MINMKSRFQASEGRIFKNETNEPFALVSVALLACHLLLWAGGEDLLGELGVTQHWLLCGGQRNYNWGPLGSLAIATHAHPVCRLRTW